MEKLSHKALLSEGRRLNGLYFSGNVYEYENCIAMIQNLREDKKQTFTSKTYNDTLERLKKDYPTLKSISALQIAYSAGIYGNTGQLHKLVLFDNNDDLLDILYAYYWGIKVCIQGNS